MTFSSILQVAVAASYGNYERYAIEAAKRTQRLIMIETQWHYSVIAEGYPLVYIEALSVAPWNRDCGRSLPRFKWVRTSLLEFSRARSEALGYGGNG